MRTVKVDVHVDAWAGPSRVDFSFRLRGDPVSGKGAYIAAATGEKRTEMTLRVEVEGGGPMAPMWEAMGSPVLPKFARGFAEQLKERIEGAARPAAPAVPQPAPSLLKRFAGMLQRLRRVLAGLWTSMTGTASSTRIRRIEGDEAQ